MRTSFRLGKMPGVREQRAALAQVIEDGSVPATDGVVRWRLIDLVQWVFETFATSISRQTLGRELRAMEYCKLSARPRHHAQAAGAVEAFKEFFWRSSQPSPARGWLWQWILRYSALPVLSFRLSTWICH